MTQRKPTPAYTPESRVRGVRLFNENRANYASDNPAYKCHRIAQPPDLPIEGMGPSA